MSKSQHQLQRTTISNFYPILEHHRSRSRKFTSSTDITPIFNKAKHLYQLGSLKQSLLLLQQLLTMPTPTPNSTPSQIHLQSLYLAATINMALNEHPKAEYYLKQLQELRRNYKGNSLLLLAICLNKQNKIQECLGCLGELCGEGRERGEGRGNGGNEEGNGGYLDGIFYRGRIRMRRMEYVEAEKDFAMLVEECKWDNMQARLYLLQSRLYSSTNPSTILPQITQILSELTSQPQSPNLHKCLKLKCEALLSQSSPTLSQIQQCQQILSQLLSQKRDSWTLLLKSKISQHHNKIDQKILLLNQCVQVKDHRRSVIQGLEALILNSMKNKDFYQAYQYSKRNLYLKIQNKATVSLFRLAQAITFLMKKKYGEALLLIGATDVDIYGRINGDVQFIRNLHYSALGYAYFSLGQHRDALQTYKKIQTDPNNEQHLPYLYNKKLCEAILSYTSPSTSTQPKPDESIKLFQSSTDYLMRSQPYFYISVILIQRNFLTNTTSPSSTTGTGSVHGNCNGNGVDPDLVMKVIEIIDSGLKVSQNYQMYYYRALLYFYVGMNGEAIQDVDRAVEKSEENVARFFYLRGLIFFQERNYESAKGQLTTCLSIDQKFYNAYLQRAKLHLLTSQPVQAYQNLSNYPLSQHWKPLFMLHQHEFSSLLLQNPAQIEDWILQTAAFQLGRFEEAGPAGKVVMAIRCGNYEEVMNLLQDALDICFQIGCLGIDDICLVKGYCCYKLGLWDKCLQMLQKSQQSLKKSESTLGYSQQDQKKLLAIKVNTIFTYLHLNPQKSLQLCQTLINDVYEGIVYDQLNKIKNYIEDRLAGRMGTAVVELFRGCEMVSDVFGEEVVRVEAGGKIGGKIGGDGVEDGGKEGANEEKVEDKEEGTIRFKFLITYPRVRVAEIENVPYEQPLIDFTVKQIDNRAQAPWMHKNEHGIIFTNKIQIFQNLKLSTQTQQNLQNSKNNRDKTSKQRMKEQLQLDVEVLNKLEKLSKNVKVSMSSSVIC